MKKSTIKDPGSVLDSFIKEYGMNPTRLAAATHLSQSTVRQITLNKMRISIPIALRFARYFGNPVDFWIDLQIQYELAKAERNPELQKILRGIKKGTKL